MQGPYWVCLTLTEMRKDSARQSTSNWGVHNGIPSVFTVQAGILFLSIWVGQSTGENGRERAWSLMVSLFWGISPVLRRLEATREILSCRALRLTDTFHLFFSFIFSALLNPNPWIWLADRAPSSGPDFPIQTLVADRSETLVAFKPFV